jgi:hypothetical protein
MSVPALTYHQLLGLGPCEPSFRRVTRKLGGARKWGDRAITAAGARAAAVSFSDLVWVAYALARTDADVRRRLRLWLGDCSAHVLPIFEAERPGDARVRDCVVAARQFARGEIDAAAFDVARAAAKEAAYDADRDSALAVSQAVACAAGRAAAGDAPWAAAGAAAFDTVFDAEEEWQFERLVARLSDPEPEDWPLPALVGRIAELAAGVV